MFASENLTVNGGTKTAQVAGDFPAVWYMNGQNVNEAMVVNIQDLHLDTGPNMNFRVEVYGNEANGDVFTATNEGDFSLTIPADLIGEHTILGCFDVNRFVHGGGPTWSDPSRWPAAEMSIEALQDNAILPELNVYTKDHHLGNPNIYVLALKIENVGTLAASDLKVRYYFSVEDSTNVPTLFDYYTPASSVKLLRAPGTNEYALELDYAGTTLQPGQSTEGVVENQIHLSYAGYATIDKYNDFSNPIPSELNYLPSSTLYNLNNKVSVYDAAGSLVAGMAHPQFSASQFVEVQ
jgi:hypothetical protein